MCVCVCVCVCVCMCVQHLVKDQRVLKLVQRLAEEGGEGKDGEDGDRDSSQDWEELTAYVKSYNCVYTVHFSAFCTKVVNILAPSARHSLASVVNTCFLSSWSHSPFCIGSAGLIYCIITGASSDQISSEKGSHVSCSLRQSLH